MLPTLAHRALERDGLGGIRDKVLAGQRLDEAEALRLLEAMDLAAIGALANHVREARHGDLTFYNRNVHLNPANVCVASCKFCSFARPDDRHASEGYTMSLDQAVEITGFFTYYSPNLICSSLPSLGSDVENCREKTVPTQWHPMFGLRVGWVH